MKTLAEYIRQAEADKVALGHFNFSNLEVFNGIIDAAKELNIPVIAGLSEGERDFVGVRNAVSMVRAARKEGIPVFLNADHTYGFDRVREAIDAGFDMVIFDGVKLPREESIATTKQCVEYAREVEKKEGRSIIVEAELGYIGKSSTLLDEIPEGAGAIKTTPDEAREFVSQTGLDAIAPSVGNIHGLLKEGNPDLDIPLIAEIRATAGVPLVLHGGSGISDHMFIQAIEAGFSVIHISTEIRKAYRESLVHSLAETDEVAPYKYLDTPKEEVKRVILDRMKLFGKIG